MATDKVKAKQLKNVTSKVLAAVKKAFPKDDKAIRFVGKELINSVRGTKKTAKKAASKKVAKKASKKAPKAKASKKSKEKAAEDWDDETEE